MRTQYLLAAGALVLLGLSACDKNPAAEAARDHSERLAALPYEDRASSGAEARSFRAEPVSAREEARERAPAPLVNGRPMWSDSRRYSAEENAKYQYEHHGEELGARSLDDFVEKAHAFTSSPPKGALKAVRANGDSLIFDPKSGLFAVARQDGAPRTVFKPEDGEAYWKAQQKDLTARARRPVSAPSDDNG
jgi:pyocin large subunit-like protein